MFGIRFIKVQPTTHLIQYKKREIVREGSGMTFFYYAPGTLLVAVPMSSMDAPFIFSEMTADFQEITVQGQVTYRIADPKKVSQVLNFSLDTKTHEYLSDDLENLRQRLINLIKVLTRKQVQSLPLRAALLATDSLVHNVSSELKSAEEISSLGLEILGLSILAIKPSPETARALEAEARERLLGEADEAIYLRRNAAVEQERAIRENELDTEISVENKKKRIREAQMNAEMAVMAKRQEMDRAEMESRILIEQRNKELVALKTENEKCEADAKAYAIGAAMKAVEEVAPEVLSALATVGMDPRQLVALAFQGLAAKAEKIGQLNVSPELLTELLKNRASK